MMRCLPFILFFILISCQHPSQKEYEEKFDIQLIKKNNQYFIAGEYDSIVNLNKKFLEKAYKTDYEDGKALCYINLGNVNMTLENYSQTQTFFDHAEKILKNSESNLHKAKLYADYGSLYLRLSSLNKVSEYNEIAMGYINKIGKSSLKDGILFMIYLNQANNYIKRKQYALASDYLYKAKSLDTTGYIDCAIGDFYLYEKNNKDSAYSYIFPVYNRVNQNKQTDRIALYANTIMGEYYIMEKDYDKGIEALQRALEVDAGTRRVFAYYTKYIYNDFRWVYEVKGDNEKAYFYLKAYTKAKNETNSLMLSAVNRDMNTFIMEAEEDAQKGRHKIFVLILIGATIFTFSGIYSWYLIDFLRQKKIKLKNEAEKLIEEMDNTVKEKAIELAKKNDPSFLHTFRKAYPAFTEKIIQIDPDLEDSELVFCAMLKLHFSSKEIAGYTFIQHRTVQQKKYRIRKKLNIPQDTDIYLFFDQLL